MDELEVIRRRENGGDRRRVSENSLQSNNNFKMYNILACNKVFEQKNKEKKRKSTRLLDDRRFASGKLFLTILP